MRTASNIKETIRKKINEYLLRQNSVQFAYLFGSFVHGKRYRDIDIAIYVDAQFDLLQLGTVQTELNRLLKYNVDLIVLNDITAKSPNFTYQIVTNGELVVDKNPKIHNGFKTNVFRCYFDTAYLRKNINQAFTNRVKSGKFGSRNYE